MKYFVATALLTILCVSSAFAHPGHVEHMIAPSIWHILSDPLHLVFLGGIVGIGFLIFRAVRKRG